MRGTKTEIAPRRWRLRVYSHTNEKGNPVQLSRTFRGGELQAETALAKFVAEVANGARRRKPSERTVDDLLTEWFERMIEPRRTPYTVDDYRRKMTNHIRPALGKVKLHRLGPAQLDAAYSEWERTLAPATVRKLHAILAAAFHQGVKWGYLDQAPTDRATPPRVECQEAPVITLFEMKAIINEAARAGEHDVLHTAIALGALTGCRRGELCALRWSDWDEATMTLTVRAALTVLQRKATTGSTKTKKTKRLPLDPVATAVLANRRAAQQDWALSHGVTMAPDPYILSRAPDGSKPCLPNGLTHAFERVVENLWPRPRQDGKPVGEPRFHFHSLRHFAATVGLDSGANPVVVAKRLGHANPSMTLGVYGHAIDESARQLARAMGDAIGLPAPALPVTVTAARENQP